MSEPSAHPYVREHTFRPFGSDWYGRLAERIARAMGTPVFLTVQTLVLLVWITLNGVLLPHNSAWDLYPFILLNLMLSFQAAYSAPLILVAANRQAERDHAQAHADAAHREEIAKRQAQTLELQMQLLGAMSRLVESSRDLTVDIHGMLEANNEATAELQRVTKRTAQLVGELTGRDATT